MASPLKKQLVQSEPEIDMSYYLSRKIDLQFLYKHTKVSLDSFSIEQIKDEALTVASVKYKCYSLTAMM